jgi:hypothetical protein
MNLVIDDAVEVKVATKTTEESRRQLGEDLRRGFRKGKQANVLQVKYY